MKSAARAKPHAPRSGAGAQTQQASATAEGRAPEVAVRLVPLDPGFYAFSLAGESGWRDPVAGLALPAIHVCAPPDREGIEVTDSFGGTGTWLGGRHKVLFVQSPAEGGAALVTAYLARDPDAVPLDVEIRRISPGEPAFDAAELAPIATLRMSGRASPQGQPQPVDLDILAHIRSRGDLRFVDTPWAGRLGPGLWIEAFTVLTRNRAAAAAIEYKGLSASGAETPWVPCGSPCGTRGQNLPLVGFAVRQKAGPAGGQFDCEYSGYFQSGATAGPVRNGAPCRSPNDNDPLEGMRLRITPRPPRHPAADPA